MPGCDSGIYHQLNDFLRPITVEPFLLIEGAMLIVTCVRADLRIKAVATRSAPVCSL